MHRVSRRQALLATLSTFFLGQLTRPVDAAPAVLRIRLDQWKAITIECAGQQVVFTGEELFTILRQR